MRNGVVEWVTWRRTHLFARNYGNAFSWSSLGCRTEGTYFNYTVICKSRHFRFSSNILCVNLSSGYEPDALHIKAIKESLVHIRSLSISVRPLGSFNFNITSSRILNAFYWEDSGDKSYLHNVPLLNIIYQYIHQYCYKTYMILLSLSSVWLDL